MSRPKKCRKVCKLPAKSEFYPVGGNVTSTEAVVMTVDEYETIRLIDYQNFTQEQCGEYMRVARTTVQTIYNNARKKLSKTLVEGVPLRIEGGDYKLCDGLEKFCSCKGCELHTQILHNMLININKEE